MEDSPSINGPKKRIRNKELMRVYSQRWKAKRHAEITARARARYAADPEKYRAAARKSYEKHASYCRAKQKAWREKYPEKARAQWAAHRAKRKKAPRDKNRSAYSAFIKLVRSAEKIRCHWCGKVTAKKLRVLDHIVPLAIGGSDSVHNLCCSCKTCNDKKGALPPERFSGQFVIPFIPSEARR